MPEAVYSQLPLWLDPRRRENAPVDPGTLKAELARLGINSRGWRLYLDYGDALFLPLGRPWIHTDQPFSSGPNAVAYLRLLQACEMRHRTGYEEALRCNDERMVDNMKASLSLK